MNARAVDLVRRNRNNEKKARSAIMQWRAEKRSRGLGEGLTPVFLILLISFNPKIAQPIGLRLTF
jgi:hypothetical protein